MGYGVQRIRSGVCFVAAVVLAVEAVAFAGDQPSAFRLEEARLVVDGASLYYRIGGSGPPLLLLHGVTQTGATWDPFLDRLGREHTVIVPDMRGHGRSTNPAGSFSCRAVAADMLALLDHLEVKQVAGIGHSGGANTLIHMALREPSRLTAMVLIGAGHRLAPSVRDQLRKLGDLEQLPQRSQENYRAIHPGGEQQIRRLIAIARAYGDEYEDFGIPTERLSTLRVRTLIVWGDNDGDLAVPLEMHHAIPGAALWVIPAQGHAPFWPKLGGSPAAAEAFPGAVRDFLRGAQ